MRDLRPQTCAFEDCSISSLQYDSFKEWISHEISHIDTGTRNHNHQGKSDVQLFRLQCPICLEQNISFSHVGLHLSRIATFSLPKYTRMEESNDADFGAARVAMRSSSSQDSAIESLQSSGSSLWRGPPSAAEQIQMPMPIRPRVQSMRTVDITLNRSLDEATCLRGLNKYHVFTIKKVIPRKRSTWAIVNTLLEPLPQEDIIRQIIRLSESSRTVLQTKALLFPFQQGQVKKLLDDLEARGRDIGFEWSLVQLNTKLVTTKGVKETTTITIFVERTLRSGLNPIAIYQKMERHRQERIAAQLNGPPQQQLSNLSQQQMAKPMIQHHPQIRALPRAPSMRQQPNNPRRANKSGSSGVGSGGSGSSLSSKNTKHTASTSASGDSRRGRTRRYSSK